MSSKVWIYFLCFLANTLVSFNVSANQFNEAVQHFLSGFKFCHSANLNRFTDINKAKSEFYRYLAIYEEAKLIDSSISTTNDRDMIPNIIYCKRVKTNLEREEAKPILKQAFQFCAEAESHFKTSVIPSANEKIRQYASTLTKAKDIAPHQEKQFQTRIKVTRCNQLSRKINAAMEDDRELTESLTVAITELDLFLKGCQSILKSATQSNRPKDNINAIKKLKPLLTHKINAEKQTQAFEAIKEQPEREDVGKLSSLRTNAYRCEVNIKQIATKGKASKKVEKRIQKELTYTYNSIRNSLEFCHAAHKDSAKVSNKKQLQKAQLSLVKAKKLFYNTSSTTKIPPNFINNSLKAVVKKIDAISKKVSTCITLTTTQIASTSAKLNKLTAKIASISGSISFTKRSPEIAIAYLRYDKPIKTKTFNIDIVDNNFQHRLFVRHPNDIIQLNNLSTSPVDILALDFYNNISINVSKIQPEESSSFLLDWPIHSMPKFRIKSNKKGWAYIANIPSQYYKAIEFSKSKKKGEFTFSGILETCKSLVLITPGYELLEIPLDSGLYVKEALTKNQKVLGSLELTINR